MYDLGEGVICMGTVPRAARRNSRTENRCAHQRRLVHYRLGAMTYNSHAKRITSENLAGQVTTTAWDCCFAYACNNRSERTNAVASVDSEYRYAYDFDDIGNRETATERGTNSARLLRILICIQHGTNMQQESIQPKTLSLRGIGLLAKRLLWHMVMRGTHLHT